ncbi:MAG: DUF58 domain-containing protein [Anaerolineae bacterium]
MLGGPVVGGSITVGAAAVIFAAAWLWPVRRHPSADVRAIDRRFGLDELLVTAVEVDARGPRTPLEAQLLDDAAGRLTTIPAAERREPGRLAVELETAAALGLMLLGGSSLADRWRAAPLPAPLPRSPARARPAPPRPKAGPGRAVGARPARPRAVLRRRCAIKPSPATSSPRSTAAIGRPRPKHCGPWPTTPTTSRTSAAATWPTPCARHRGRWRRSTRSGTRRRTGRRGTASHAARGRRRWTRRAGRRARIAGRPRARRRHDAFVSSGAAAVRIDAAPTAAAFGSGGAGRLPAAPAAALQTGEGSVAPGGVYGGSGRGGGPSGGGSRRCRPPSARRCAGTSRARPNPTRGRRTVIDRFRSSFAARRRGAQHPARPATPDPAENPPHVARPEAGALRFDDAFMRRLERWRSAFGRVAPAVGSRTGRRRTPAADFVDHRAYSPGDDLRHIDWPALARHDAVFVKLGRVAQAAEVRIILDVSASMAAAPRSSGCRSSSRPRWLAQARARRPRGGGAVATRSRGAVGAGRRRARAAGLLAYLAEAVAPARAPRRRSRQRCGPRSATPPAAR